MKITTEALEDRQILLTIEVDKERTRQVMRRVSRQIARQVNIPGFRKGKAPYQVIVQRFGEDTVRREAADLLADDVYREALDQEGIEPYAAGELTELLLDPLTFKLTIPLRPLVDLGDYREYRLKPRKVRVYKKEVEEALEKIREEHAYLEPVERPVRLDDGVVLDLVARSADGVEILKGEDIRTLLEAGSADPASGFSEAVVGMTPNEMRVFTLTLPDDFPQEPYRGQDAEFTVRLTEVYEHFLPDLNDDLARAAGSFESLKKLEDHIRDELRQAAQAEADQEYTEAVVQAVIEQAHVEHPAAMLEQELDAVVEEAGQSVRLEGQLALEDLLRIQGRGMEEFREELLPQAATRLKRSLVLGEIVAQEGIAVDDEEVSARIDEVSAPWGDRADEVRASLRTNEAQRTLHSRLLAEKAIHRLVAIAKGEAAELTPDKDSPDEAAEEAVAEEQGEGEGEE